MDSPEQTARPRVRLQRFLASCGLGSRRACEEFITEGRITVDGQVVSELGATVDPSSQKIALDGERLKMERKRYYVLHKPPGFLCTNSDPSGRKRAIDLLPADGPRLFTVGRLDENSTGLLVVTNDGDLAEKLAHPRHQIFRTYQLQVAGHPKTEVYEALKSGLRFAEGRFKVRSVKSIKKVGQSTWLEVILTEGHNRELRRLFARVGHKVLKLTRVSFGPIRLGRLKMGEFRDLSMQELEALHGILTVSKSRPKGAAPHGRETTRPRKTMELPAGIEYDQPMFEGRGEAPSGTRKKAASKRKGPVTPLDQKPRLAKYSAKKSPAKKPKAAGPKSFKKAAAPKSSPATGMGRIIGGKGPGGEKPHGRAKFAAPRKPAGKKPRSR